MKAIMAVALCVALATPACAENSYAPMRDCDTTLWLIDEVIKVNSNFSPEEWEAIDAKLIQRHPDTPPLVALRAKNTVDGALMDMKKKNLSPQEFKEHLRREWHC